jgi:succinate dehydrogenase / fumarate reductase, cytochrome b subunit
MAVVFLWLIVYYNMATIAAAFNSSIGKKLVMAFTGLFLISFLVIHVTINSMIFLDTSGAMFNEWAKFMSHNYIVRFLEVGLFAGFIIHIIQGFKLTLQNNAARKSKYAVSAGNATSKWYSRSMGILGSLLLIFLVVHISHFWLGTKASLYLHNDAPHDTFTEMRNVFKNELYVIIYIVGTVSLAWHLVHGFPSAFQTLGINNSKYNKLIKVSGYGFSIIVPLLFTLMPLAFYFNWI